jgi:hypothetical protein
VIYNPDLAAEQSVLYFKTVTKACGSRNVARKFDERVKESYIMAWKIIGNGQKIYS